MILVMALAGVRLFGGNLSVKADCQARAVADLSAGAGDCAGEDGRAALLAGTDPEPAGAGPGERVLTRSSPLRAGGPPALSACVGMACQPAFACRADAPAAPPGAAPNAAPNAPAPKPEAPRDPVADKLAEIDRLDDEVAALREQRKNARTGSAEDRLDNAIAAKERRIAELGKELFGARADWRRAGGAPQNPGALPQLMQMDTEPRQVKMARLSPADIRQLHGQAEELAKKVDADKRDLEAARDRVTSPQIAQLRAEADAAREAARAHFAASERKPWVWETDTRKDSWASALAESRKAGELNNRIRELQIEGLPPDVRARYREVVAQHATLTALRQEIASAHLPPTLASNEEAVRALKGDDLERAWVAWALHQRELDRIAAFEASLARHPDRAQIQAEIDIAIAEARKEAHAPLPPAARAELDRYFVPKAVIGDDGKITVSFVPTRELRQLQMQQAAYIGYERIEFNGRRVRPFSAPSSSREALAWWLTFGSTQPRRLGHIVEPNHSIRATHDEMILVPGGTLMRGVGTVGARQLVRSAVCEVAVNAGMAVAVEEVSKKFGPAAGAGTPFAVILTAIVTRRVVGGPRATAAGPALNAETKAVLTAEAKAAQNAARAAEAAKGFKTQPMNKHYEGEHLPNNAAWGTSTVKYLDDAEREAHRLHVRDGKLYDASGKLFDTRAAQTHFSGNGRAIFVMDDQGRIYASTYQEVGKFHHSSLLAGKPVTSAGELVVENGVLKTVSNRSGHYRPPAEINEQVFKSLEAQGVDVSRVTRDFIK
jgi:hypothetical protein